MTDRSQLLVDLARLMHKHGPEAFADLANYLRSPEAIAEVASILERMALAGHRADRLRGRDQRAVTFTARGVLARMRDREPAKAELLSGFYDALAAKQLLPTLSDVRLFALDNGLAHVTARTRDGAIRALVVDLATRQLDELRPLLQGIALSRRGDDRTLDGWSDVILGRTEQTGGGS